MFKFQIVWPLAIFLTVSCSSTSGNKTKKSMEDEIADVLRRQGELTPVNQFFETGVISNKASTASLLSRKETQKKVKLFEVDLSNTLNLKGGDEKVIQQWVDYFSVKDRERFQRMLNRGEVYREIVQNILIENGLPTDLFYLALIESGFVTSASSHASAKGVWQFMKGTGKQYGLMVTPLVDERDDPIRATEAAAKYLRKLYSAYESWELAFAAYNAGEYRILSSIMKGENRNYWELAKKRLIPSETRNYVPKIMAAMRIARNLNKYGFKLSQEGSEVIFPDLKMYQVKSPVRVKSIAAALSVSEVEVLKYNPHLRNGVTPLNKSTYYVWFPDINSFEVQRLLSKVPREKNQSKAIAVTIPQNIYKVKRGDTLSGISRKLNTPIYLLKKYNKISSNSIYAGQRLRYKRTSYKGALRDKSIYRVRSGDTLSKISKRFNIRISNLKKYNNIRGNNIFVGQRVILNPKGVVLVDKVHVVKRGENLTLIARKYGMDIRSIKQKNNLKNNNIYPGQRLNI